MKVSKPKYLFLGSVGALVALAFIFQNCSKVAVSDIVNASQNPFGNVVCSPFDPNTLPTEKSGLKTELRYISSNSKMSPEQKNAVLARQYFESRSGDFITAPAIIYLPDVNVPTRRFESGFSTSRSTLIKDNQGQVLIEYFALKMESVVQLGPNDPEGYYELATISDDGTVLQIFENNKWVDVIQNDGPHSTRMGCMNRALHFTRNTKLPIRLYYNQGPRTEISNVMIWNYLGASSHGDSSIHSYCGQDNSEEFWSSHNSQEGPWVRDLWQQGWKVLAPANFVLPNNESNPCAN